MDFILIVCFVVVAFMCFGTCKKASATINELRKELAICNEKLSLLNGKGDSIKQSVQSGNVEDTGEIEV